MTSVPPIPLKVNKNVDGIRALLVDLDDTLYRSEEIPTLVREYIQSE